MFYYKFCSFLLQQMDPAKQMKVMQEFQKQSAQMDMTVCNLWPVLPTFIEWLLPIWQDFTLFFWEAHKHVMGCCVRFWQSVCTCMHWLSLLFVQNEMMSDSIDNVLDDDQAEDETEELANQVISSVQPHSKLVASLWNTFASMFLWLFILFNVSFRCSTRLVLTLPHR